MDESNLARVYGRDIPISAKHAVEIANFIRGKSIQESKNKLQQVLDHKIAVPFTRYNRDIGHKPNIGAGRYPQKAIEHMIKLLNSLEANALNKGLNIEQLFIKEIITNKASEPYHPSRLLRRRMKRTHIRIVAQEKELKEKEEKEVKK